MANEQRKFMFPQPIPNWSDSQLLSTAIRYGEEARAWRSKFLGLLPEIDRRKLYEQKGFPSIFFFAKVIGGVSEDQVRVVLNLEKRFEDKPALHQALVSGEISVNKLARVASIATVENAEELIEKVQVLPRSALETYVRDIRDDELVACQNTELSSEGLHVQTKTLVTFELTTEVQEKLEELHVKGIDINEIILHAIEQREQEIEEQKEKIGEACEETNSRHIPKATRDLLKKEYGTKCSIKKCKNPWKEAHHTQRFALPKTHDPRYMALFCKDHHKIAHLIDQKYCEKRKRPE